MRLLFPCRSTGPSLSPARCMRLSPALIAGADFWYILRAVVGISGAGVLLSYSLHSGYLDVIQSLRVESDQDDLTKLYNRKAGLVRMGSLLALCKRMSRTAAAYYIDIDYFKSYNDTYGHLAGDHALIDVSSCIRRCFARETDVLCRMGGEEFAVLIPVVKKDAAPANGAAARPDDIGYETSVRARTPHILW